MTPADLAKRMSARKMNGGWLARCPTHEDRTPSLSISQGTKQEIVLHCHAGCDPRDVLAELRSRGLLDAKANHGSYSPNSAHVPNLPPVKPVDTERLQRDLDQGRPIHECPLARRYYEWRGIDLSQIPWPTPLIFRESFRNWITDTVHPAILAPIAGIHSNKLQALHITFLRPDASGKADIDPPRLYAGPKKGGCCKLTPDEEITYGLGLGEGIETSLSTGFSPMWATLDAGNMKEFPVLPLKSSPGSAGRSNRTSRPASRQRAPTARAASIPALS
jgi:hypothetical protein